MRILILAVLVLASVGSPAAQTPARDTRQAPPAGAAGTGSISGVVSVDDGTGRTARYANVLLLGATTGTLRITSADTAGQFAFSNLPADQYTVGASKLPYIGAVAGARRPGHAGTPIAVADGQRVSGVSIRLMVGAVISGTVTDDHGQPAINATVALQQWRMQGVQRLLVTVGGGIVSTDEHGRYRVAGLMPGQYVVAATGSGSRPYALKDTDVDAAIAGKPIAFPKTDPVMRLSSVYFPGVARSSEAMMVSVAAGEEQSGIDIKLENVRPLRVDGIVVQSDGQPAIGATVTISTAPSSSVSTMSTIRVASDGRFSASNLAPGNYIVVALSAGSTGQFAGTALDLSGADVTSLQLTLKPPMSAMGHLVFDGANPPTPANRRVPVQLIGATGPAPQVSVSDAAGAFTISRLTPGRLFVGGPMFFGATNDSVTWALESVVIDGRDVTDLPFDVTGDTPPKDVVVTYGDRWQALSGRLAHASGAAAPDYVIVLFPADKAYWIPGSRRILTARPGSDGQFHFGGQGPQSVATGNYLLAAVTDIDRDEQFDPSFLTTLLPAATPITIHPGERKAQDLEIR